MAKKKMLFIYNPKAGKGQIKNNLSDIIDIFVKAGNEVTVYPTQYAGDAVRMAAEKSKKYDLLVCSGGDGTLDEVVTGIMQSNKLVPVGYIPAGSTNDFANSLGIPKNMKAAAETVVDGRLFPVTSAPLMTIPLFILRLSGFSPMFPMKQNRNTKTCWATWHIFWRA